MINAEPSWLISDKTVMNWRLEYRELIYWPTEIASHVLRSVKVRRKDLIMKNLFGVFLHFFFWNMTTGYLVYETSEIPEARAFWGWSHSGNFKNLIRSRYPRSDVDVGSKIYRPLGPIRWTDKLELNSNFQYCKLEFNSNLYVSSTNRAQDRMVVSANPLRSKLERQELQLEEIK